MKILTAQIKYGSYFGDVNKEIITDCARDKSGNIYILGDYMLSGGNPPLLPTNSKSFRSKFQGTWGNSFVAKFNSDFKLLWCSFLSAEYGNNKNILVTDSNLFICITTSENNLSYLPTKKKFPNKKDLCLFKFDLSGNIITSTYFGGKEDENLNDFFLGPNDEIFIVGTSNSTDSLTTTPSYCPKHPRSGSWPFVAKFDKNLKQTYGSYLGKGAYYSAYSPKIAVDNQGGYVIGLQTDDSKWSTIGSFQNKVNGSNDVVVMRFNKNNVQEWSTFIGGEGNESLLDIYINPNDNSIFLQGWTYSKYKLIDSLKFGSKPSPSNKILFAASFDVKGKRLFSRYLGGTLFNQISTQGKYLDRIDNYFVYLSSVNSDPMIQSNVKHYLKSKAAGGVDARVFFLDSLGNEKYNGFVGGENDDEFIAIFQGKRGLEIVGRSTSYYDLTTKDANQQYFGGDNDLVFLKIESPIPSKLRLVSSIGQCSKDNQFCFRDSFVIDTNIVQTIDSVSDGRVIHNNADYCLKFDSIGNYKISHFAKYKDEHKYTLISEVDVYTYGSQVLNLLFSHKKKVQDTFLYRDTMELKAFYNKKPFEEFSKYYFVINGKKTTEYNTYDKNYNYLDIREYTGANKVGWNVVELYISGKNTCAVYVKDSFYVIDTNTINGCTTSIINTNPVDFFGLKKDEAKFKISVVLGANVLWQSNSNNLGWTNIPLNSYYSGINSTELIVKNIQVSGHMQKFRAIVNFGHCVDTSITASVFLSDTCNILIIDTIMIYDTIAVYDTLIINVKSSRISSTIINKIKVFPNPAGEELHFDFGDYLKIKDFEMFVYDASGKVIHQTLIQTSNEVIDISGWASGLYTIQIVDISKNILSVNKIKISR